MLTALVSHSIRHRGVVLALALLVVAYGMLAAWRAKVDVYPEFTPPQVTVQTEAPGLSRRGPGQSRRRSTRLRSGESLSYPSIRAPDVGQAAFARVGMSTWFGPTVLGRVLVIVATRRRF